MHKLIQSNATRWNSYYMSIVRALNCKKRIQQFCDNHHPKRGEGIENDRLRAHHWFLLDKLRDALHPFYESTLCSEGNDDILSNWFYTLDYLFDSVGQSQNEFDELASENPESEEYTFLQAGAAAAWLKTEEYYKKADESAAYYAASVLNPAVKWVWFEEHWGNDPIKKAWLNGDRRDRRDTAGRKTGVKGMVQELWEEEYKGKYSPDSLTLADSDEHSRTGKDSSRPRHPDDQFGGLHRHKQVSAKPGRSHSDRYMTFISTEREETKTGALEFWNARYTSQPDLARFALDMLAIPMMSAECERVFSSAKHLITDARNRLHPDTIEANECLKHWFGKPKEEACQKPKASGEAATADREPEEEVAATETKKDDESDVEDGVVYDVDSDGEIVWKN